MPKPITTNTLFYGDNLPILREHIADESVDLIYLDPPFNSNRLYNVLFKGRDFPKIQILSIEELLDGAEPKLPIVRGTFRQTERVKDTNAKQKKLDL